MHCLNGHIAADGLPHIFDRFYRADKSRSRADGHVGSDAAGGRIEVDSTPDVGTTFLVRLPDGR